MPENGSVFGRKNRELTLGREAAYRKDLKLRMKTFFLLLPTVFLLLDCNRQQPATETPVPKPGALADSVPAPSQGPDDDSRHQQPKYISRFANSFLDFQTAIFNEDFETFNQFIDPERGVYIIENPGAMPKLTQVKDIRYYKREPGEQSFFTIKDRLQSCKLKEEALPVLNCEAAAGENAGYNKEGCFVADAAEFRNSGIHKFAELPQAEIALIESTLPLVQKTVLQTASSYRFHFGLVNGKLKVLFIDLRLPCSA